MDRRLSIAVIEDDAKRAGIIVESLAAAGELDVQVFSSGPMIAETRPPAMTYEIALGRKLSDAVSAAAKR